MCIAATFGLTAIAALYSLIASSKLAVISSTAPLAQCVSKAEGEIASAFREASMAKSKSPWAAEPSKTFCAFMIAS